MINERWPANRPAGRIAQDMIGGRVDYICNLIQDVIPHVKSGTIKAVANLSRRRSPMLPDLATANEQGFAGFDI
jgi:tripartite-type tricarboxylate transporter receptor subunit TctC